MITLNSFFMRKFISVSKVEERHVVSHLGEINIKEVVLVEKHKKWLSIQVSTRLFFYIRTIL